MAFRNRAKCRSCGDIIESKHRHDFVTCTCYQEGQKKINEYIKEKHTECDLDAVAGDVRVKLPTVNYTALYSDPVYKGILKRSRGFFLDGGPGVDDRGLGTRCGGNPRDIEWMVEDD